MEAATDVRKMLKQNAVRSKNAKLKFRKFSTLQKRETKTQRKKNVLQYGCEFTATDENYYTVIWFFVRMVCKRDHYFISIINAL